MRLDKFGKLKVVELSPTPYVVPIIPNNEAYVVLETAEPSHVNQPVGGVNETYGKITPEGQILLFAITRERSLDLDIYYSCVIAASASASKRV